MTVPAEAILAAEAVAISFGGVKALEDVSFSVRRGEVFSIIGPNGAGKTTLFNVISGIYRPRSGRVLYRPQAGGVLLSERDVADFTPDALAALGLSRTFQNLQIFLRMSVAENVMVGRHLSQSRSLLTHALRPGTTARETAATASDARALLDFIGLSRYGDQLAGSLPYGALKRLEIARALASDTRLLLLDEPAAGCNATETAEIDAVIRRIVTQGVTVVLVEHDMKLVMAVSDRVLVLNQGRVLCQGTPDEVRSDPVVIEAYLGRTKDKATTVP
jgi:branched-chain amino acid transport system ATP-binding protein